MMTAFALTLLFALTGIVSLAVLGQSLRRGFASFGELRRALANCDDVIVASLRIEDHARPARLVLVSSRERPAARRQPVLRAAA